MEFILNKTTGVDMSSVSFLDGLKEVYVNSCSSQPTLVKVGNIAALTGTIVGLGCAIGGGFAHNAAAFYTGLAITAVTVVGAGMVSCVYKRCCKHPDEQPLVDVTVAPVNYTPAEEVQAQL